MSYWFKKEVGMNFDEAVSAVKDALKSEGFGILTEIDVKKTLKEKLNAEHEDYLILGACNPPFAYKALQKEKEIGLLLPCNLIVYSDKGKTYLSAIDPLKTMSIVKNKEIKEIAQQVRKKLKNVLNKTTAKQDGMVKI